MLNITSDLPMVHFEIHQYNPYPWFTVPFWTNQTENVVDVIALRPDILQMFAVESQNAINEECQKYCNLFAIVLAMARKSAPS